MRVQGAGKNRMEGLFGRKKKRKLGGEGEGFYTQDLSELKVLTKKVGGSEGKEENKSCRRSR